MAPSFHHGIILPSLSAEEAIFHRLILCSRPLSRIQSKRRRPIERDGGLSFPLSNRLSCHHLWAVPLPLTISKLLPILDKDAPLFQFCLIVKQFLYQSRKIPGVSTIVIIQGEVETSSPPDGMRSMRHHLTLRDNTLDEIRTKNALNSYSPENWILVSRHWKM